MKLSVIIPCFNAEDTIAIQLNALACQSWSESWEVVVANNRSTDNSMRIVEGYKKQLPNLRIVDASARQGQPYALNIGAACARGDAIAFCDADDEVAPGWVAAMGEALSKYDFVACRIDTERLNAPWIYPIMGNHPQREGLPKIWYPPYLLHAGGGTLGVKRSLHDAIGGFDETLPYLHDTDYCFRLQLMGVQLHFVKEACTCIRCRDKLGALFHQGRHWAEYNVKVYKKYRLLTGNEVSDPWKRYLNHWRRLLRLRRILQLRNKREFAVFMWNLGWQVGYLHGSIKHRIHPVPA